MKFVKGQSGNPAGRPKNSGALGDLRKSILDHVPDIITRLVINAKCGDVLAAKLLLERVLPPVKSIEEPVEFELAEQGNLTDHGNAILQAASDGDLTPSQASSLLSGLGSLARIKELDELDKRITALESLGEHQRQDQGIGR